LTEDIGVEAGIVVSALVQRCSKRKCCQYTPESQASEFARLTHSLALRARIALASLSSAAYQLSQFSATLAHHDTKKAAAIMTAAA
jgi:uncharacterized PurR-regulated membrane protein YhhQ (DUF165 family)